jgi:hypothetical protein
MLSSLLDQRRTIRSQAHSEVPSDEEGPIVATWVDALIVALSHSTLMLLEPSDSMPPHNAVQSIYSLRHDDQIRAVCLLPCKNFLLTSALLAPRLS